METVTDFIFLGSKITTESDYSLKIKRRLLFGTLHSDVYIFPFLLCFSLLFLSQLFEVVLFTLNKLSKRLVGKQLTWLIALFLC